MAHEIRGVRRKYFRKKRDVSAKLEEYVKRIESKKGALDDLEEELMFLEREVSDRSSSLKGS